MVSNHKVFGMFPSIEPADRRLASLHRVLRTEFPCFGGTIKALRLPAVHPTALRFLRLAVPRLHGSFAPPVYPVRPGGLELFARYLLPGSCRGDDRISQVPGVPRLSVCPCSSTPAGLLVPDQLRNSSVAPAVEKTKAPTMMNVFEAQ